MKLAVSMPTFSRWFQLLVEMPRSPYVAFGVACVIATTVFPIIVILTDSSVSLNLLQYLLIPPIWLPVLAADLALLFWSKKLCSFRPSLMLRLLILMLVVEGYFLINHYCNPPLKPPHSSINEETMNEVIFMSLYGAQCVLLLILEPGLRHLLKRRLNTDTR